MLKSQKHKGIIKFIFFFLISFLILYSATIFQNAGELNVRQDDFDDGKLKNSLSSKNKNYFAFYKEIIINHDKVSGTESLVNFTLLISIFDTDLHDKVQSDGDDIAFYNGSEQLDHEIELFDQTYNETHAYLVAWVRIPLLSPISDTKIFMYYGNSTMESCQNPTGVWDNKYEAVWHMNQDPSTSNIFDSTSNNYDLTPIGFDSDQRTYDEKLGVAISVDGTNDRFNISGITGSINDMSFQTWFKPDTTIDSTGSRMVYFQGNTPDLSPEMRFDTDGTVNVYLEVTSDNSEGSYGNKNSWAADTWFHFTYTRSMSAGEAYHYVDGSLDVTDTSSDNANPHLSWDQLAILSDHYGGNIWGSGAISEFRILNVSLSADWIATEYNNQYEPNSFYTLGEQKIQITPDDFNFFKTITIDHNEVSGTENLIDFPLLISIFDSDLANHTQQDGDDIAFYNGFKWLDYEIEKFNQTYNATHAQLIAWVRIPSLSPLIDTIIYLYYDNPSMISLENPEGVWGLDYKAIWHLKELGGSGYYIKDSTNNFYDGSPSETAYNSGGKIDGCREFSSSFGSGDSQIYIDNGGDIFDGGNYFMFSFWLYPDVPDDSSWGEKRVFDKASSIRLARWFRSGSPPPGIATFQADIEYNTYGTTYMGVYIQRLQWNYVVYLYNGTHQVAYVNGVRENSEYIGSDSLISDSSSLYLGTAHSSPIEGSLDEFRVLHNFKSSSWIKTEYNNQYDPNSFYTLGEVKAQLKPEDFNYYKKITIDHTQVSGSGNLLNFPYLISIFDSDLHDKVQSDGDDIAFYNGTDWLDYEIETFNQTYNATHAQLAVWVKIPSLSPTTDTTLYMYYGNSTISSYENPIGVWDENYRGVWHLSENPSNPAPQFQDSTYLSNNGFAINLTQDNQKSGQIDGSLSMDNNNDFYQRHINVLNSSSLQLSTDVTVSAWVRTTKTDDNADVILAKWGLSSNNKNFWLGKLNSTHIAFFVNENEKVVADLNLVNDGEWHYIVGIADSSTNQLIIFVDGVKENTKSYSGSTVTGKVNFTIGSSSVISSQEWQGGIDETRVSNLIYSEDWIATEYSNQHTPNNFLSLGTEKVIDFEDPTLKINSPSHNELFGKNSPTFNVEASDNTGVNTMWYVLSNGTYNSTMTIFSSNGTIDLDIWNQFDNGTVLIRFYVNDSGGNTVWQEVTVRKDVESPSIGVNNPISNELFGTVAPNFDVTITDPSGIHTQWYTIDGGITNYTFIGSTGTIDQTAWNGQGNGTVTIRFYTNDSAGNLVWEEITIRQDINPPSIGINNPTSNELFGTAAPNFDVTISDPSGVHTQWYTINDGITNYTFIGNTGTIDQTAWNGQGNGTVTIRFYTNDSTGNLAWEEIMVRKDINSPSIGINIPTSNELFGTTAPNFDVNVSDPSGIHTQWYTINDGITNYTIIGSTGTIDQTAWEGQGNGTVTIRFYTNDSAGNFAWEEITVKKDINSPSIGINIPTSNELFGTTAPNFDITVSDPSGIHTQWYTIDGGITNYTFLGSTGAIDQTVWNGQGNGTVTIRFYANDSAGNLGWDEIMVRKDSISPSIGINNPTNNQLFGIESPNFDVTITDPSGIHTQWYTIDGGITNYTYVGNTGIINPLAWQGRGNGTVTIRFYANDSAGNLGWDEIIVRKDSISPSIGINNPTSNELFGTTAPNFDITVSDPSGIHTQWYTIDGGITNYTFLGSTGAIDQTAWNGQGNGTVTIRFYANDSIGNIAWNELTVRKDIILPLVDITTPSHDGGQLGGSVISISGMAYGTGSNIMSMFINDSRWGDGAQKPQTDPSGSSSGTFIYTNNTLISPGYYWIEINITDVAGNVNTTFRFFEVLSDDTSPPILVISSISPDPTNGFTEIIVTSNEELKFAPMLNITLPNNSVIYRPMILINELTWCANYTVDTDGTYLVMVNGTDKANNIGYAQDNEFTGDITLPSILINTPTFNDLYGKSSCNFDVNISDNYSISSRWYTIDGGITNYIFVGSIGTINPLAWQGRGNGTVTIRFYANDSAGNVAWNEVTVRKDINSPTIGISSPESNDLFGTTSPNYVISISDINGINLQWYSLDGGITNYTFIGSTGIINQIAWEGQGNGTVIIRFYANDSVGNVAWDEIRVRKDIEDPDISINSPTLNELYGINAPDFDVSITDASGIHTQWYTIDNGLTNITFTSNTGTINNITWVGQGNGTVIIRFYANDTAGNIMWQEVIVRKDIITPQISIENLAPFDIVGKTPPATIINIIEPNHDTTWYQLINGSVTTENYTWTGIINQNAWNQIGNGTIIIRFYVNDSAGNFNFTEVILRKDIINPEIFITEPSPNELFGTIPPNTIILITEPNQESTWYQLANESFYSENYTWSGMIQQNVWDKIKNGTIIIRFYVNDSAGNIGIDEITVRKDTSVPLITILSPEFNKIYDNPPTFSVLLSGSNLVSAWYTLDGGLTNYTFSQWNETFDQNAWESQNDGNITIKFYLNNSLGRVGFNEISVIKDTIIPQIFVNYPLDHSYVGQIPILNIETIDAHLESLWYTINTIIISLKNGTDHQIPIYVWNTLEEGMFEIHIYANDSIGHVNTNTTLTLYKDITAPNPPKIITCPNGEVSYPIIFDWEEQGNDLSGILFFRIIIDDEVDPFSTPGFVHEVLINNTDSSSSYYELMEELSPGTYYFFIYQIDGCGHQSNSASGSFIIASGDNTSPKTPNSPEFPLWIILIIIIGSVGAISALVVIIKVTKSKNKKSSFDDQKILSTEEVRKLREKRESLEKEAKLALKSGNYEKAATLFEECKNISNNLFRNGHKMEARFYKEYKNLEFEAKSKLKGLERSNFIINVLLTNYFDDIEMKYYSNPGIYPENQNTIDGLILNENNFFQQRLNNNETGKELIRELNVNPSDIEYVKAIQFIYTNKLSEDTIIKYCEQFQHPEMFLIIVGIDWPAYQYEETMIVPHVKAIKYRENIKVINHNLFADFIGLKGDYSAKFNEIIESKYDIDQLDEFNFNRDYLKQLLFRKRFCRINYYFTFVTIKPTKKRYLLIIFQV
ncbi:MAG: DUF2341 domain-containing protein [Candidatus Lokiarchaeota archaeon]